MENKRIIKSFSIKGLFGTSDLIIPFEDKVKILIGENGLGKTQVLSMVYYTLTKNFGRLINFAFESIAIEFVDGEVFAIEKKEIEGVLLGSEPLGKKIISLIGFPRTKALANSFVMRGQGAPMDAEDNQLIEGIAEITRLSQDQIASALFFIYASPVEPNIYQNNSHFSVFNSQYSSEKANIIDSHLKKAQILYFPTYRRVEEDLKNLGYDEEKLGINQDDTSLIHFGMDDVDKRFDELTSQIEKLSKDGLSKISSEILSQLVNGLPSIDNKFLNTITQEDIDIILARVGSQINAEDKSKIKQIVETKEIKDKDHSLLYFLQKLIHIYDQQRELDRSISIFRDLCNKYLVNKKIIYDASSIEIYVQPDGISERLPLSKLSSGEKQIISIFSKIYLAPSDSSFIVLFDEPELSLSIFWQRELLPDIFNSGKCQFLLAVTHSPFIFENSLDKYAIEMNQYLAPLNLVAV